MSLDLYIYEKMLKILRERREATQEALCFGAVADFAVHKELRAVIGELAVLEQELKALLDTQDIDD
jgi:hypothetical protein|tara:strand:+ start:3454 stop:3651 length:198 start_codon:yes stop_codon:yes gene_type:complete